MAEQLVIRIGDAEDGAQWAVADGAGRVTGSLGEGGLQQAAAQAAGRRVLVLVPGQQVLFTRVDLPTQQRQRALRAVPYALEEQVVGDVDDLHFALGPQQGAQEFPVAVVARALMDSWQGQLRRAGIMADLLGAETLALPWRAGEWSLWVDGSRILVRTGPFGGFAADVDSLEQMLGIALQEAEPRPDVLRVYGAGGLPPMDLEDIECIADTSGSDGVALLAAGAAAAAPFNLLQGAFSRRAQLSRLWRPWRATAALVAVVVVLGLTSMGVESYQLSRQDRVLGTRIDQVFRRTFPQVTRLVDVRAQMQQGLAALQRTRQGAGGGFLELLQRTGSVLHGTAGVRIDGINYRSGQMDLSVSTPGLHALDQLKRALARSTGLKVDIQSATTGSGTDKRVQGRLRIEGGGA